MGQAELSPVGGTDYRVGLPFKLPQKKSLVLTIISSIGKSRADVNKDNNVSRLIILSLFGVFCVSYAVPRLGTIYTSPRLWMCTAKMCIISGINEANNSCLFLGYKMYLGVSGL